MMASYARIILIISIALSWNGCKTSSPTLCDVTCQLPECFCRFDDRPSTHALDDTPQMVLVTYTGPITKDARSGISAIFPDHIHNPVHECPMGVTFFAVATDTNYCAAHRLYVRGHEIALGGSTEKQIRNATSVVWQRDVQRQKHDLVNNSYIPESHIRGLRAPLLRPGGDEQFGSIYDLGFQYDSSLFAEALSEDSNISRPWPFTLDLPYDRTFACNAGGKCPKQSYPGLWEMPVTRLVNHWRSCAYVDNCLTTMRTSDDVFRWLYRNYRAHRDFNRAPMQINLRESTLRNKMAVDGIKMFVNVLASDDHNDTWVLTMQEALDWIRSPVGLSDIRRTGMWSCDQQRIYHRCYLDTVNRTKKTINTFRLYLDVDRIWYWQIIALVVGYLALKRHERVKCGSN